MDWRDITLTSLTDYFVETHEFPEGHARKLARTLIDMSEPEFGEE